MHPSADSASPQFQRAEEQFKGRFGCMPRFAAAAPGRVNLIGEHTDYNQGFVLPIAIDRWTFALADLARRKQSTLWSIDLEEILDIDLTLPLQPLPGKSANYLLGVVQQFIERGHVVPNLDIAITSTVPIGAGLASSAAIEVAFATVLEQIVHDPLRPVDKAMLCQRAEHAFPGTPCGIMDMYTSVMAKAGHALLIDCRSNKAQYVRMPPDEDATVLIVDTHVAHDLATGEYAKRRASCQSAAHKLGVPALRDVTIDMLHRDSAMTSEERRCALHVIAENTRTILAATALGSGDIDQFGELMFASHESLRDLFQVSCRELDVLVESARSIRKLEGSVFGARMTGGGFGGCAVVLCRTSAVERVAIRLESEFESAFGTRCTTFTMATADGARAIARA